MGIISADIPKKSQHPDFFGCEVNKFIWIIISFPPFFSIFLQSQDISEEIRVKSEEFELAFTCERAINNPINCNTKLNFSLFTFHSSLNRGITKKYVDYVDKRDYENNSPAAFTGCGGLTLI